MSVSLATITSVEALAAVLPRAGTFSRATIRSNVKAAAAFKGATLVKESTGPVRFGVQHRNLQAYAGGECPCGHMFDAIETGALPWGAWMDYPRIIAHNGALYVRLYAFEGALKATYMVDGTTVDRAEFNKYLTASAAKPRSSKTPKPCPQCGRKRVGTRTLTPLAASISVG
jgi:hypothetical protein